MTLTQFAALLLAADSIRLLVGGHEFASHVTALVSTVFALMYLFGEGKPRKRGGK